MDIKRIERRLFLSDLNSEMLEKKNHPERTGQISRNTAESTVIVAKRQYGNESGQSHPHLKCSQELGDERFSDIERALT